MSSCWVYPVFIRIKWSSLLSDVNIETLFLGADKSSVTLWAQMKYTFTVVCGQAGGTPPPMPVGDDFSVGRRTQRPDEPEKGTNYNLGK